MTSLYRRHRPQSFADVVGQGHIVRTLSNAVEQDKVHHAYLFVGSRGTGKTSIAKILARSLNCVKGQTLAPCGECESCRAIANSTSLDVIEMDAASNNSVDDIRDLREKVGFAPALGTWKVYILDEAHMLSSAAWNAFLKTLEEPPPHTIFVLATTEAHKVPATIVDRCHRFDFQRPTLEQIATVLGRIASAEQIEADDRTLSIIGRSAAGSFRDAIGTLDQLVTYSGKKLAYEDVIDVLNVADADLIFKTTDAVIEHDAGAALEAVEELLGAGRDPAQFMRDLTAHLRQLVVVQTIGRSPDAFSVTADQTERLESQAQSISQLEAVRTLELLASALTAVKEGSEPRIQLELALLKAARPRSDASIDALLARIERLEQTGGAPDGAPQRTPPRKRITGDAKEAKQPAPTAVEEPQAAAEVATAIDDSKVGELAALWPAVLEQVSAGEGGAMLAALLGGARPAAVDDNRLVLAYPSSASFSKRKVESPANQERIREALRRVTGQPWTLSLELSDDPDAAVFAEPLMSEEEAIAAFRDAFDAEDVDLQGERSEKPRVAKGEDA
jgi:DNA polymerase III subunit gamma/tau